MWFVVFGFRLQVCGWVIGGCCTITITITITVTVTVTVTTTLWKKKVIFCKALLLKCLVFDGPDGPIGTNRTFHET